MGIQSKAFDMHRRVNNVSIATIDLLYPTCNELGIRHHVVYTMGSSVVPNAYFMQKPFYNQSFQTFAETSFF